MDRHFTLTSDKSIYNAVGDSVTFIGQPASCDVRLPNKTDFEDVIFAKIIPVKDDSGWVLVRMTGYYPIYVNGQNLNRVHYLQDGDFLDFDGYGFRFNIREGNINIPSITHIHRQKGLLFMVLALVAIVVLIVSFIIWNDGKDRINNAMISEIESSLYMTRVDSIQLMRGDTIIDAYVYEKAPVGTAFLTKDSLLVTARHCLQPWLNKIIPEAYSAISSSEDWSIANALLAETQNQLNGTEEYRLVSFLTLTDPSGKEIVINSDRFTLNYDMDEIVEVGDYNTPLYWRSISHRYSRRDMMLDDIAVTKLNKAGKIELAGYNDILHDTEKNTKLYFFGFPETGVNGNHQEMKEDILRLAPDTVTVPNHIFMLAHEGGLAPGFSGGPVIFRSGSSFKAIGVISVTDDKNQNFSYSVPVSEIKK